MQSSGKLLLYFLGIDTTQKNCIKLMEDDPKISIVCKDLIQRLLESDPAKRLKIDAVLKHPFVSSTVNDY